MQTLSRQKYVTMLDLGTYLPKLSKEIISLKDFLRHFDFILYGLELYFRFFLDHISGIYASYVNLVVSGWRQNFHKTCMRPPPKYRVRQSYDAVKDKIYEITLQRILLSGYPGRRGGVVIYDVAAHLVRIESLDAAIEIKPPRMH